MQRCKAKSKRSGFQCKNYALRYHVVCRMHGAKGGPKTDNGLLICKEAPFKHGFYSKESKEEMQFMRQLIKEEQLSFKFEQKTSPLSHQSI